MLRCSWCSEILVGLGALVVGCRSSRSAPDAAAEPAPALTSSATAAPSTPMTPSASASAAELGDRSSLDAGREVDAGPDYEAGECPDFEPSRWEPFLGLDLETRCWFFVPAKEKLPEPIVWEPCGRAAFGPGCRKMKAAKGQRFHAPGIDYEDFRAVHAPASGPVRVQVLRSCERQRSRIHVIAAADGPVLSAMADDSEPYHCHFEPALQPEGWVAKLSIPDPQENENTDPNVQFPRIELGLAAGRGQLTPRRLDEPPKVVSLVEPSAMHTYRERTRFTTEALGATWAMNSSVKVGTDGSELVWSRADGEGSKDCEVFRAPWTDNPSKLGPVTRVLGVRCKDVHNPWTVGCGYAATTTVENKALLVRLNDGTSYTFPTLCGPLDWSRSCETRALALTCNEVYLALGGPDPTIARVAYRGLPKAIPAPEPPRQVGELPDAGAEGGSTSRDGAPP